MSKKENWFAKHFYWPSSTAAELADIKAKYLTFVEQHAELYENKTLPVSVEAKEYIIRKKKLAIRILVVFLSALGLALLAIALYMPDQLTAFASGMIFIVVGYGGGFYLWHRNLSKPLEQNEMQVVQGVITAKTMSNGCFVEISLKQKFQVMPEDYKKFDLGDIIKIEILGKDMLVKRFITPLGKI